jgi:hypothetical protein
VAPLAAIWHFRDPYHGKASPDADYPVAVVGLLHVPGQVGICQVMVVDAARRLRPVPAEQVEVVDPVARQAVATTTEACTPRAHHLTA